MNKAKKKNILKFVKLKVINIYVRENARFQFFYARANPKEILK